MCWTEPVARAVELARGNNARVVFDVDDLMFRPDVANTEIIDGIRSQCMSEEMVAQGFSLVRHTLAHADHATAPTETLAHELRCAFKPASVIPNGFDRHTLALARTLCHAQRKAGDDGWLRIGYASGSLTHQRDLAVASGAIADVLLAHPRVRLVLFEHAIDIAEFPELAPFTDRIEWRPLVPVRELPKEYARFDISIAPLEVGNVFCEAKSELKFFEPVLCGVVTVASPTRPFREAIRHGETGFLAAGPDEWRKYLEMLITDPDLRRRVAEAALADVLVRYGPERRIVLVNRLLTRLLAPPPVAGEVTRTSLLEPQPAAKGIDTTESDIVYASPRRGISRVAVVVPLYNYAQYVREALDSVAAQTVRELDVIVVDDCSTDNSLNVAKTWLIANQHKFNHVALLQNKRNAKLSRTRNSGICYADAELVLPLDADNQLLPSCVERCIALLDETNAALAYPTIEMFGDRAGLITEHDWDAARLQCGNYIDAMAMFRKACWLTVGGYSPIEHGWEDYDLWCKFVEAGFWAVRVPEVTARYRVHGQSMLHTVTEVPENRERTVDDLTHRHPWLDIIPPSPAPSAEPEQLTATPVRLAPPCVAVNLRLACEALLPLLQCPDTGEPLDRVGDELRSIHSGHRWPIVDGRPVFTKEGRDVHRHSSEHVSNPLPKQAIDLIEGTKGPVLNLSGGATSHSFEHVFEAEYSLFRTTDVAADAHCLPFKDEIFDLVICLNAFEHYRDPRTVTNEIRRVLRPGGKLFIHTAFMQPLHEAPHHYFNCTKYGLREWLHQFEIERISVSDNLNPAYAFSWLASEIESAFATCVSEEAAGDFLSAPVGSFVALWRDEGLRHSPLWQAFFQLPEDVQERFAAGWEALAYRRSPTAI
jgi:SAM-dependent methyltransferase